MFVHGKPCSYILILVNRLPSSGQVWNLLSAQRLECIIRLTIFVLKEYSWFVDMSRRNFVNCGGTFFWYWGMRIVRVSGLPVLPTYLPTSFTSMWALSGYLDCRQFPFHNYHHFVWSLKSEVDWRINSLWLCTSWMDDDDSVEYYSFNQLLHDRSQDAILAFAVKSCNTKITRLTIFSKYMNRGKYFRHIVYLRKCPHVLWERER